MRQFCSLSINPLIVFLLSLSISLAGFGQHPVPTPPVGEWSPLLYLDSVQIGSQFQYDPDKIASVDVVKDYYDSARHIHGKIFIRSKVPGSFRFLSVADLTRIYSGDGKAPTIFMVDDGFLMDTTNFRIDSSYVLKVRFIRAPEIAYLNDRFSDLIIEKIIIQTKENIDRENRFWIRGEEQSLKQKKP